MTLSAAAKQIVVILGAGPGLGLSVARKFAAQGHPVALLSRSKERLESLASQINTSSGNHGSAAAFAVDVHDEVSVHKAIEEVHRHFSSGKGGAEHQGSFIHTGVFSPGGGFVMAPFLETQASQVENSFKTQVFGGFVFSQAILKAIASRPALPQRGDETMALGNILLTGATASRKGGANLSAFSSAKFGLRALGQSLAREWGPKGVHVAHFIIDGIIATERTASMLGSDFAVDSRIDPDAIAQVYLDTVHQARSAWAFEVDLRPFAEKW